MSAVIAPGFRTRWHDVLFFCIVSHRSDGQCGVYTMAGHNRVQKNAAIYQRQFFRQSINLIFGVPFCIREHTITDDSIFVRQKFLTHQRDRSNTSAFFFVLQNIKGIFVCHQQRTVDGDSVHVKVIKQIANDRDIGQNRLVCSAIFHICLSQIIKNVPACNILKLKATATHLIKQACNHISTGRAGMCALSLLQYQMLIEISCR